MIVTVFLLISPIFITKGKAGTFILALISMLLSVLENLAVTTTVWSLVVNAGRVRIAVAVPSVAVPSDSPANAIASKVIVLPSSSAPSSAPSKVPKSVVRVTSW